MKREEIICRLKGMAKENAIFGQILATIEKSCSAYRESMLNRLERANLHTDEELSNYLLN